MFVSKRNLPCSLTTPPPPPPCSINRIKISSLVFQCDMVCIDSALLHEIKQSFTIPSLLTLTNQHGEVLPHDLTNTHTHTHSWSSVSLKKKKWEKQCRKLWVNFKWEWPCFFIQKHIFNITHQTSNHWSNKDRNERERVVFIHTVSQHRSFKQPLILLLSF